MYEDTLDGRINQEFFDRKAKEWKIEQEKSLNSIHAHQTENGNSLDGGIKLLELASTAPKNLLEKSPPEKNRRPKDLFEISAWKDGRLSAKFRQPFDMISLSNPESDDKKSRSRNREWLK